VIPYIAGEEDKIEVELGKILGAATAESFLPADIAVSAHCHRVPALDGHLEAVSVELDRTASPEDAMAALDRSVNVMLEKRRWMVHGK